MIGWKEENMMTAFWITRHPMIDASLLRANKSTFFDGNIAYVAPVDFTGLLHQIIPDLFTMRKLAHVKVASIPKISTVLIEGAAHA